MQRTAVTRRGRMDITADILQAASRKSMKKTHILFQAALNNEQVDKYLGSLTRRGLLEIEKQGDNLLYKTSDKGKEYLRKYHELEVLLF